LTLTPSKTRALYGSYFAVEGSKIVGYDKPAGAADRTPLVDAGGKPLSFDDALKRIIDMDPEKDTITAKKLVPGAGSKTNATGDAKKADTAGLFGAKRILAGLNKGE
jgi:hypothetical protein